MAQRISSLYAETLILLKIWSLAAPDVAKSNFLPSSKSDVYKKALENLETEGAISAKQKNSRSKVYSITDKGKDKLEKCMMNKEFIFSSNIGAKTANSFLNWFRDNQSLATGNSGKENENLAKIKSYKDFQKVALDIHDELNRDYNLANLVPIYRVRREIGERVSRSQFNEWLLELQANDLIQLMGGEMPNVTQDQREDSVTIPGGSLRFYIKRL